MMGGQGFGFGGTWGIVGWIISMLFFLLIIVGSILLVLWLVRQVSHPTTHGISTPRGMEILKERYAKGEISKEEFERMKKDLIQ